MNANATLLQMKYARVVSLFAKQADITLSDALTFFYHSNLYQLVKNGALRSLVLFFDITKLH